MQGNWESKISKIQSLMEDSSDSRQMALSLLDALVEPIRAEGVEALFNPIFEGMTIEKDYLSLPALMIKLLSAEKEKIANTYRWSRDYTHLQSLLEEDLFWPLWEIYFRIFPEKIQLLPEFLLLEGVRKIPSFCNEKSPVKAFGFSHPMYGFDGLETCTHIKRVHFYHKSLPFIRSGYRRYYQTLASGYRFDPKPYIETVKIGVEIALSLSNVEHLFAFNIQLDPIQKNVPHLISTNLNIDVQKYAPNIQYATNALVNPSMPRLEMVSVIDSGKLFFVTDPLGRTNGRLSEHPRLLLSSKFLGSIEDYHAFLDSKTTSKYLEHFEIIVISRQRISKHRVRFFLNDSLEDSIRDRIEVIEMQYPTKDMIKLIWSTERVLSSLREVQIRHTTGAKFSLSKDLLLAFPKLEIVDIVHKGYEDASISIRKDFWDESCAGHPLKWIENHLAYSKQAFGFRTLSSPQETLAERIVFFQSAYNDAILNLSKLKHVEYMRLQQCENLAPIQENAIHMRSLLAEHNSKSDLSKVLQELGCWTSCTTGHEFHVTDALKNPTTLKFRPTVMAPITKVEGIQLFFERKKLCQREVLNRPLHLSKDILQFLQENFNAKNSGLDNLFNALNINESHRFGKYTYYFSDGSWKRTTYQSIDEEYDKAVVDRKIRTYNLERSFCKREFSGELLQESSVKYNTKKVPVSALKDISNLTVLKIERELSEDEWKEVSQLDSVSELYFVDQKVAELPRAICSMSNLKKLFLWGNEFTSLPQEFTDLQNLETLSVTGNLLNESKHDDLFNQMSHIVSLYR